MEYATYKDKKIKIMSFRDLTDIEIAMANVSTLPEYDIEPRKYAGQHYLALPENYEYTAFLIPSIQMF